MTQNIDTVIWKHDTKYALVTNSPIPFLVCEERNGDIVCYGKAERNKIVPLNGEDYNRALQLGFVVANRTAPNEGAVLYANKWEYDPTFSKIRSSVPFLVREEKKDIVCYGKAQKDKIVPLNEREVAVAHELGLIIWDKSLSSVTCWPRLSEIENRTIIDFTAITIDIDRIPYTDDSVLFIVEASLGLPAGSIRENPSMVSDLLENGGADHDPSVSIDIIFQRHIGRLSGTWWVSQGEVKIYEERNNKGKLKNRTLMYDGGGIRYERVYSDDGLLLESYAKVNYLPTGPHHRFSNGIHSIEYMINGEKTHEKAWNDYITQPIKEGTLFPKELCLLVSAYLL